jgi:hypothetical protein
LQCGGKEFWHVKDVEVIYVGNAPSGGKRWMAVQLPDPTGKEVARENFIGEQVIRIQLNRAPEFPVPMVRGYGGKEPHTDSWT